MAFVIPGFTPAGGIGAHNMEIRIYAIVVTVLVVLLQYQLWSKDGSLAELRKYQQRIESMQLEIQAKKERNDAFYAEIDDLRRGQDAMEERARYELGMILPNETFFQVLE